MRKTHEQVKAELLARRDRHMAQRKRRQKTAVLTASVTCAAVLLAVALPYLPGGDLVTDAPLEPPTATVTSAAPQHAGTTGVYDITLKGESDQTQVSVPEEEPDETQPSAALPEETKSNATTTYAPVTTKSTYRTYYSAVPTTTRTAATVAPHGSTHPYRGALADFVPVAVRLPYEGNTVQALTADATALWDYGLAIAADRPRKTLVDGDEMLGARYVVFRAADGYELTCIYCDTCVGFGNAWYDITAEEAAAIAVLTDAVA